MVAVTVIDHGAGNLRSVIRALRQVGASVRLSHDPEVVATAEHLLLPGQGAFADCMQRLRDLGLDRAIVAHIQAGRPYLGICLGLQVLFEVGHEHGTHAGLGVFEGTCERLPDSPGVKVPHMGWNHVERPVHALKHTWLGSTPESWFYFVHSYRVLPKGAAAPEAVYVQHGAESVVAAVARDNVMACQFHPEKSHDTGLALLQRFLEYS